jgi:hypothetical protein
MGRYNVMLLALLLIIAGRLGFAQSGRQSIVMCTGDTIRLKAASPEAYLFQWSKDDKLLSGEISDSLILTTPGTYRVVCFGVDHCMSESSPPFHVLIAHPVALNDTISSAGHSVTIPVLNNDTALCTSFDLATLTVVKEPSKGKAEIDARGQIVYTPNTSFSEADSFSYSIADQEGNTTNIAKVYINVSFPLPLGLLSFRAEKIKTRALLTWEASEYSAPVLYEVLRSADGKTWDAIGNVSASGDTAMQRFSYTDSLPEEGANYYRLKLIPYQGHYSYSPVGRLYFEAEGWISVYPNPVSYILQVRIAHQKIRVIRLSDAGGKVLLVRPVSGTMENIDMSAYSRGTYYIQAVHENGTMFNYKVTKT